jgi:capsular exopolysaccharide synthesis family protein
MGLFFGAGFLYSYKQTDIYAAQTQILLKSANNEVNTSSIIQENFGSYYGSGGTFIDNSNEIRVIRSYDLIKRALDRLDFDVSYFLVGRIRTTELFDGIPFHVKLFTVNPDLYEQQIRFKVLDINSFQITYKKDGKDVTRKGIFDQEFTEAEFRILVTKNGLVNAANIAKLKTDDYIIQIHVHDAMVYQMQMNLDVKNPDYTNVLEVSLKDVLPQRAIVFLDTLSKVYIENTLQSKLEVNENTLRYIDNQMGQVTSVLNNIEDTMQGFKERNSILDLGKEGDQYFAKLNNHDAQKTEANLQIGALNDLENYIIVDKDPEFLPPSMYIIAGDQFLSRAVTELYSLQLTRNSISSAVKDPNPAMKELNVRIEALKKNLLVYLGNLRTALKEKIKNIEVQMDNYVKDIRGIPIKQRGLVNIQRKLSVNENMYIFLLQKRSNTVIAKATIIPETKVIEAARSLGPVEPNRKKIITNFIFIGLFISMVIIFVRVVFFARIESVDELKSKTKLAVVGEVLFSPMKSELIIAAESEPKSPVAEAFRTIRTNLQFMATKNACKTIVITSNSPGEGKTFCSLNLAGILAKAGKHVLILELDLHKPRVQKGLNIQADIGISTIVIGKNSIEECIKHTHVENMDAILSGPLPPNPSEIVLTKELAEVVEFGKQNYDYVIIDTPPVGLISDAVVLMKMADVSLFVINTKYPYKESIENAHELVELNKLVHFGFILNGVKRKKSKYYYNRYSYGYGYGNYGGYGSYGGGYGSYGGNS